jgi:two-component system sensor histidine kinase KdpD
VRQSWRKGGVFVSLMVTATAGGFLLDHHVSLTSQAMLYVLAVVLAAYTLDWLSSVVFAITAVTLFNFFFVPPRWTFEVDSREHLIALFTMLLVALVISHLTTALRRETDIARRNEQRARQLQALASALSGVGSAQEVMALGHDALALAFEGPCTLVQCLPDNSLEWVGKESPQLEDGMRHCMKDAAVLGPGTGRWPGLNAWYLPLGDKEHMNGAVCIQNVQASDVQGREHAQALCALLAQALWRLYLSASMLAAQNESQRQHIQSTFLAAISHDFRTPLAAVVGAASALQTQGEKLDPAEKQRLLGSIISEANYLSVVTENTLQLVRLTNAPLDIQHGWESMEEIVGAVLARVRQRDPARRIKSRVPAGLPLIRGDPVLLAQLIGNLLDNALKYSSDTIELEVVQTKDTMQVYVKDRGQGIPESERAAIFEPYSRTDQSGQRGVGLGLAVCRAIAKVHGGSLVLRPRNQGGSSFVLSLAVDPEQPTQVKEMP